MRSGKLQQGPERAASRAGSTEHFLERWPRMTCGQNVPQPRQGVNETAMPIAHFPSRSL